MYEDPITRKVLMITIPKNVIVEFYDLNKGLEALKSVDKNECIIVLFKELLPLYKVIDAGIKICEVNIARLPYKKGKFELLENVYISKEEIVLMQKLINKEVKLFVQMVPDSIPIDLNEIVTRGIYES